MNNLFKKVETAFKQHQTLPNLEVELRLGKKNGTMFDTNIGEDKFNKIKTALENYSGWENVKKSTTSSYFLNDKRCDFDEESEESTTIIKNRLVKIDHILPHEFLDVRFAIAQEIPSDDLEGDAEFVRHKSRVSYVRKNLSIDLTIVSGDSEDMDDESENKFEVEFEIIDPTKINSKTEFYNIIYKVQCILKTL
jgi:hypothetical protein